MQLLNIIDLFAQLSMVSMIGLYFIFSNTIMPALSKVQKGGDVMVEINRVILNPIFYSVFFVSAGGSLYWSITKTGLQAYAGLVFFIGTFVVTIVKNVPMNNRLMDAQGSEQFQAVWQEYLKTWTLWNHVRTVSAMIAGALLLLD